VRIREFTFAGSLSVLCTYSEHPPWFPYLIYPGLPWEPPLPPRPAPLVFGVNTGAFADSPLGFIKRSESDKVEAVLPVSSPLGNTNNSPLIHQLYGAPSGTHTILYTKLTFVWTKVGFEQQK
jgi:hypothetical protein